MAFYDDMQTAATDILRDFQQSGIRYVQLTAGDGTIDNPGEPTEEEFDVEGVARGVQFKYVDNSNIVASDGQVTMPVSDEFTPNISGSVIVGGRRHKILAVKPIPPTGTTVAYVVIYKR